MKINLLKYNAANLSELCFEKAPTYIISEKMAVDYYFTKKLSFVDIFGKDDDETEA